MRLLSESLLQYHAFINKTNCAVFALVIHVATSSAYVILL